MAKLYQSPGSEGKDSVQQLGMALEWLALFDDDELANPDWLKELYAFAVHIGAQCVGGCRKLAIPEDIRSKLGPVCRGLLGEDIVEDIVKKCNGRLLPIGGHMLIKRAVFDAVGVFDGAALPGRMRGPVEFSSAAWRRLQSHR